MLRVINVNDHTIWLIGIWMYTISTSKNGIIASPACFVIEWISKGNGKIICVPAWCQDNGENSHRVVGKFKWRERTGIWKTILFPSRVQQQLSMIGFFFKKIRSQSSRTHGNFIELTWQELPCFVTAFWMKLLLLMVIERTMKVKTWNNKQGLRDDVRVVLVL